MSKLDWRYVSLMAGMILGYAAAIALEQWGWISYPGLLFRVLCVVAGGLLGHFAFWTFKRMNPG
jgi:hypothetical protein